MAWIRPSLRRIAHGRRLSSAICGLRMRFAEKAGARDHRRSADGSISWMDTKTREKPWADANRNDAIPEWSRIHGPSSRSMEKFVYRANDSWVDRMTRAAENGYSNSLAPRSSFRGKSM